MLSMSAIAPPSEWPTTVTVVILVCEMAVWTAERISAAVLYNFIKLHVVLKEYTHFACSLAKPLWTFTDDETPGNKELSSSLKKKFASVAMAILMI